MAVGHILSYNIHTEIHTSDSVPEFLRSLLSGSYRITEFSLRTKRSIALLTSCNFQQNCQKFKFPIYHEQQQKS